MMTGRTLKVLILCSLLTRTSQQNCTTSKQCFEQLEARRIQEVKDIILSELGLSEAPDMSKMTLPSDAMRAEYLRLIESDLKLDQDLIEKEYLPAIDPSKGTIRSLLVAGFPMDESYASKDIQEVKLSFFADIGPQSVDKETISIHVYERQLDGTLGSIIATRTVTVDYSQRLSVDIRAHDVKRWLTTDPIMGLFVVAKYDGENVAIHPQETDDENKNMILTVISSVMKRKKRAAPKVCTRSDPELGCCLYDLMIDFKKIGWDWIIAPPRYNAFICRGDCHYNKHHMQNNGHSKLIDIASRMGESEKKLTELSPTCCHPSEYEGIVIVYMNRESRVAVAKVNSMSARKCNCA